jgi:hypothetical protein
VETRPLPRQIDSWRTAEENAADWMRFWGYTDARCTTAGPDGGVDIRSSRALAQVKMEAAQVGAPELQRLVGARGRDDHLRLLFFTGAGYSRKALEYANTMDIALFSYRLDGSVEAVNPAARHTVTSLAAGVDSVEPAVAAQLQEWVRASQAHQTTQKYLRPRGWVRRNWPLLLIGWVTLGYVRALLRHANGTTTDPLLVDLLLPPALALLLFLGWAWSRDRWNRKAAEASTNPAPDPGSLPAIARELVAACRAGLGEEMQGELPVVKALIERAPGLGLSEANHIVRATRG